MGLIREFKEFAMKGNVLDLAIGIIIGGGFGKIVSSFVADIIMPPIGMALSRTGTNWQELMVGPFAIGKVIAALINFIIVALFVFWASKMLLREASVVKK